MRKYCGCLKSCCDTCISLENTLELVFISNIVCFSCISLDKTQNGGCILRLLYLIQEDFCEHSHTYRNLKLHLYLLILLFHIISSLKCSLSQGIMSSCFICLDSLKYKSLRLQHPEIWLLTAFAYPQELSQNCINMSECTVCL